MPKQDFVFSRKTRKPIFIQLTYPWDKKVDFYLPRNELIKILIRKVDNKNRKQYPSSYYFNRGSLIHKEEDFIAPQDITELKKLFETYRLKAENIKAFKRK